MASFFGFRSFPILVTFFTFISLLLLVGCAKYSDEIQANLTKLTTTKSCSGFDLTGANLTGANLNRVNLRGADLTKANLYRTNLTGTKSSKV
jgi:uncharacterized protein YjbI with pentapeptide repeats